MSDVKCNLCGLSCLLVDQSYATRSGLFAKVIGEYFSTAGNGYGALDDLTSYEFSLCEFCLDWLFSQFKLPVRCHDLDGREGWKPAADRVMNDEWRQLKDKFWSEYGKRNKARADK